LRKSRKRRENHPNRGHDLFLCRKRVFSLCFAHNIRAIVENYSGNVFSSSVHGGIVHATPGRLPLARATGLMQNMLTGANAREGRKALLDFSRTAGLGLNLRRVRTEKGLTLDRLASLSELTRGYISLVERGLKVPSIAALLRLAKALDVSVAYLFDPNSAQAPRYTIYRRREQGAIQTRDGTFGLSALAAGRTRKMMEPFLLTPPHKSAPRASHHAGEEMLFVVSGKIVIKLDGEDIAMDKGDCLYFAGETPHEVRSVGRQKAEVLVVVALPPAASG
jgi:transcriptional regulator with XRE-family HTH domain